MRNPSAILQDGETKIYHPVTKVHDCLILNPGVLKLETDTYNF